jgi:hypothetical protein
MPKSKELTLNSEKSKKVNTSLRLDRSTLKALKQHAIEDDTSVQKIVEKLIESYLKKVGKKK